VNRRVRKAPCDSARAGPSDPERVRAHDASRSRSKPRRRIGGCPRCQEGGLRNTVCPSQAGNQSPWGRSKTAVPPLSSYAGTGFAIGDAKTLIVHETDALECLSENAAGRESREPMMVLAAQGGPAGSAGAGRRSLSRSTKCIRTVALSCALPARPLPTLSLGNSGGTARRPGRAFTLYDFPPLVDCASGSHPFTHRGISSLRSFRR
jgi:hypothetical protein